VPSVRQRGSKKPSAKRKKQGIWRGIQLPQLTSMFQAVILMKNRGEILNVVDDGDE
jgi:hypothetical protein